MRPDEFRYTGKTVEREMLGEVKREYFERYDVNNTYLTYRHAMKAVREMQSSDPTDPEPRFASDLHATVAEKLGLEEYDQLKFFTAIPATHLDLKHGVDAFFEYDTGNGIKKVVTMDVTTRVDKESQKANILITVPSEGLDPTLEEDKEPYKKKIEDTANLVVDIINNNRFQAKEVS